MKNTSHGFGVFGGVGVCMCVGGYMRFFFIQQDGEVSSLRGKGR